MCLSDKNQVMRKGICVKLINATNWSMPNFLRASENSFWACLIILLFLFICAVYIFDLYLSIWGFNSLFFNPFIWAAIVEYLNKNLIYRYVVLNNTVVAIIETGNPKLYVSQSVKRNSLENKSNDSYMLEKENVLNFSPNVIFAILLAYHIPWIFPISMSVAKGVLYFEKLNPVILVNDAFGFWISDSEPLNWRNPSFNIDLFFNTFEQSIIRTIW